MQVRPHNIAVISIVIAIHLLAIWAFNRLTPRVLLPVPKPVNVRIINITDLNAKPITTSRTSPVSEPSKPPHHSPEDSHVVSKHAPVPQLQAKIDPQPKAKPQLQPKPNPQPIIKPITPTRDQSTESKVTARDAQTDDKKPATVSLTDPQQSIEQQPIGGQHARDKQPVDVQKHLDEQRISDEQQALEDKQRRLQDEQRQKTTVPPKLTAGEVVWIRAPQYDPDKIAQYLSSQQGKKNIALQITIDAQGNVMEVKLLRASGIAQLDDYVLRQTKKARSTAYRVEGIATAFTTILNTSFETRDADDTNVP